MEILYLTKSFQFFNVGKTLCIVNMSIMTQQHGNGMSNYNILLYSI